MKKFEFSLICFLLTLQVAWAGKKDTPELQYVPIEHIYVPTGFDSNDDVQIIVAGELPNLCHKSPTSEIEIVGRQILIDVQSYYYDSANPFCPQATVPFMVSVNVGLLDKGNYEIVVNSRTRYVMKSGVDIAQASPGRSSDDHIYAGVQYVDRGEQEGTVVLKGYNPSDCFRLKEIKSFSNGVDTFSVLPIMEQVSDFCPRKMIPFSYEYKLPAEIPYEKLLLHVRSMDGRAINSLYQVDGF